MDAARSTPVPLGVGLYTVSDAARLTGMRPARVRRWLFDETAPVVHRTLPRIHGRDALTFLDLVETLFVRAFLGEGVTMKSIREAAIVGKELLRTDHPFCSRRMATDGRKMFVRVQGDDAVERLVDTKKHQFHMRAVLEPLLKQIDYDDEMAARWWPPGTNRSVVIDPAYSFGAPHLHASGVPTETLYDAWSVERDVDKVARWYDVPANDVQQAIDYEERLRNSA